MVTIVQVHRNVVFEAARRCIEQIDKPKKEWISKRAVDLCFPGWLRKAEKTSEAAIERAEKEAKAKRWGFERQRRNATAALAKAAFAAPSRWASDCVDLTQFEFEAIHSYMREKDMPESQD